MTIISPTSDRSHTSHRAFTLIELLAVIAVVAMAAGYATIRFSSTIHNTQLRHDASAWMNLDRRARQFARTGTPVMMTLDSKNTAVRIHAQDSGEMLGYINFRNGIVPQLQTKHGTDSVLFNRRGISEDYTCRLNSADASTGWNICGLSGTMTESQP